MNEKPPGKPKRRGRRLAGRLSKGHMITIGAGLLGVFLTLSLLGSSESGVRVAVAGHALEPGERIKAGDLEMRTVQLDSELLERMVRAEAADELIGRVVVRRVNEGELVTSSDFGTGSDYEAGRTMSVPVERARALGGNVAAGDVVDLIAASAEGAWYVATGVEVVAVDDGSARGALPGGDERVTITVTVDERSALDLARAISGLDVTVIRSTGAGPVSDASPLGPIVPPAGVDGSGIKGGSDA